MKRIFSSYIYENPIPRLYPRNSAFPSAVQLPDGRLLAAHQMGIAFIKFGQPGVMCLADGRSL